MFGITEPALADRRASEVGAQARRGACASRPPRGGRGRAAAYGAVAWITGGMTNRIEAGNPASAAWVVVTAEAAHVSRRTSSCRDSRRKAVSTGSSCTASSGTSRRASRAWPNEFPARRAERIGGLGIDVDDELVELRLSLDPAEQERLAALAADAAAALERALCQWVPGELDVGRQARVAAALETVGAFGACLIVGGDDRVERFRHPLAAAEPVHRLRDGRCRGRTSRSARRGDALRERRTRCRTRSEPRAAPPRKSKVRSSPRRGRPRPTATRCSRSRMLTRRPDTPASGANHYQGGPIGYRQREFEIVPSQVESRWFTTHDLAGHGARLEPERRRRRQVRGHVPRRRNTAFAGSPTRANGRSRTDGRRSSTSSSGEAA